MNKKVVTTGLIVGVANLVVGMVLSQVYNFMSPAVAKEYINPAIFRPWSDPLMTLFFLYPFIVGVVLAWVWAKTKGLFSGKTVYDKAYKFAFAYFIIATIPGMFITYTTFQVSLTLVLTWAITGLVETFVAGLMFAKMLK